MPESSVRQRGLIPSWPRLNVAWLRSQTAAPPSCSSLFVERCAEIVSAENPGASGGAKIERECTRTAEPSRPTNGDAQAAKNECHQQNHQPELRCGFPDRMSTTANIFVAGFSYKTAPVEVREK